MCFIDILGVWLPAIVSLAVVIISILAYQFSRDRFRLELFHERLPIYEAILDFCSEVVSSGSATEKEKVSKLIELAYKSFRGKALHKSKALFGKDVLILLDQLNEHWSIIITHVGAGTEYKRENLQLYYDHFNKIHEIAAKLPESFKPYMYFGNFKKKLWAKY